VDIFKEAAGRKLNSIECHDICCKTGEIVICGGVRRSALISLSNPSDDRMRYAKSGEWWKTNPQRALANNSACYTEKPGMDVFMREWLALYDSKSGERGIFNREAAKKNCAKYGRRDPNHEYGTNPCCEVVARSAQCCNLTEAVARPEDTEETLKRKVRLAVIMGTMQATLTKFTYLRDIWRKNTEEEALLGVSITGILDNKLLSGVDGKKKLGETLGRLREYAVEVNKEWATKLGINPAAAVSCVKPSGTVSALVNCSSGIHPRFSKYFVRTVRADKKDPLAKLMVEMGFPHEDDVTKPEYNWVFSFPMMSPECSTLSESITALEHLELWKTYQDHWTEHKPSITVYVREHEWMDVGAWVFRHFDSISGVAFLPYSGHNYRQAPFQPLNEADYKKMLAAMPKDVDWAKLGKFEVDDNTQTERTMACSGDSCDLADLTKQ
jgi:ribonucleoside-diphosphate reductase alpha chain